MKRIVAFDVLKIFAAFGVVLIHVTGPCAALPLAPGPYLAAHVANAVGRCAVPVFLMISGALLLGQKTVSLGPFYKKALMRYAMPTVAWFVIYKLSLVVGNGYDIYDALYVFKTKNPAYHLWYMWMFLGICLAFPFLHAMFAHASQRFTAAFLAVCGTYAFIALPLSELFPVLSPFLYPIVFSEYLFYFVLGHTLGQLPRAPKRLPLLLAVYAGATLCIGYASCALAQAGHAMQGFPASPRSPLVAIQAASVFLAAGILLGDAKRRNIVETLAATTFGIFFIHVLFVQHLDPHRALPTQSPALLFGSSLAIASAVFAASFAATWGLRKIPVVKMLFP